MANPVEPRPREVGTGVSGPNRAPTRRLILRGERAWWHFVLVEDREHPTFG